MFAEPNVGFCVFSPKPSTLSALFGCSKVVSTRMIDNMVLCCLSRFADFKIGSTKKYETTQESTLNTLQHPQPKLR